MRQCDPGRRDRHQRKWGGSPDYQSASVAVGGCLQHSHPLEQRFGYAYGYADRHADGDANRDANGYADCDAYGYTDRDAYRYADGDLECASVAWRQASSFEVGTGYRPFENDSVLHAGRDTDGQHEEVV